MLTREVAPCVLQVFTRVTPVNLDAQRVQQVPILNKQVLLDVHGVLKVGSLLVAVLLALNVVRVSSAEIMQDLVLHVRVVSLVE